MANTGCCIDLDAAADMMGSAALSCQPATLDCTDPFSAVIEAILRLDEPNGSTILEIEPLALSLCPALTAADVAEALTAGAKRGIFRRIIPTADVEPSYMINANMASLNPKNAKYVRPCCQAGGFYG